VSIVPRFRLQVTDRRGHNRPGKTKDRFACRTGVASQHPRAELRTQNSDCFRNEGMSGREEGGDSGMVHGELGFDGRRPAPGMDKFGGRLLLTVRDLFDPGSCRLYP
jgi:hypothetical protein